jgi:hypothetical protein
MITSVIAVCMALLITLLLKLISLSIVHKKFATKISGKELALYINNVVGSLKICKGKSYYV